MYELIACLRLLLRGGESASIRTDPDCVDRSFHGYCCWSIHCFCCCCWFVTMVNYQCWYGSDYGELSMLIRIDNILADQYRRCCWSIWIVAFAATISLLLLQSALTDWYWCWCSCCCCWSLHCCCCCWCCWSRTMRIVNRLSVNHSTAATAVSNAKRILGVPPLLRTELTTRLHSTVSIGCFSVCPYSQAFVGSIIILKVKLLGPIDLL